VLQVRVIETGSMAGAVRDSGAGAGRAVAWGMVALGVGDTGRGLLAGIGRKPG